MKKVFPIIIISCLVLSWITVVMQNQGIPKEYSEYLGYAQEAYKKEYYVEALDWIEQAESFLEESLPYDVEAFKCKIYNEMGDMDSYVAQCKFLIRSFPEQQENYVSLVEYYADSEDMYSVFKYLDKYLEVWPDNEELLGIASEYEKKYAYNMSGYYDVKYATDKIVNVQVSEYSESEGVRTVERKLISNKGRNIFDFGYQDMEVSSDGSSCFVCDQEGKWSLVNIHSYLLARNIDRNFEKIGKLATNGIATALIDGEVKFINKEMMVADVVWEDAYTFNEGINAVKKNGKWAIVTSDTWSSVADFPYIDVKCNSLNYCMCEGLCVVADSRGYYIVDSTEFLPVSENVYEELKAFESIQPTAYRKGDKWGFVNSKGNVYIEAKWEDAKPFTNGYAAVKENGLWGYINSSGNYVIEPQFLDALSMMENGTAYVKNELGYWDYLTLYRLFYTK